MPPKRDRDPAEIERRLDAGEWLSPPDVAALLGKHPTTVTRWADDGALDFRLASLTRKRRRIVLDPVGVKAILAELRKRRRATPGKRHTPDG